MSQSASCLSMAFSSWGFLASIVLINQYVTENKLWLFENAALFRHFLTFSEKENLEFSRRYRAGALEYSFHYRAVFLHSQLYENNCFPGVKSAVKRRENGLYFVVYWCFPATKHCFHRSFTSNAIRFLPFSRTVNAWKRLKTKCSPTFTGRLT